MEEKEIIKKLVKVNKEYFNILVDNVKKRLYVISFSRLGNKADAEDAVQETLFEVYKNISKLKEYDKFNSWITKILINKCNTLFNKSKNDISIDSNDLDLYYYNPNNITNNIDLIDDKLDFFSLLKFLEIEDRTLLAMFYSDEYSSKEISSILNINESTIRSKIKRAREKLKNILERGEQCG